MFAGNFIGDVARRVLLKLAEQKALFDGVVTPALRTTGSIAASDLVNIERYEHDPYAVYLDIKTKSKYVVWEKEKDA